MSLCGPVWHYVNPMHMKLINNNYAFLSRNYVNASQIQMAEKDKEKWRKVMKPDIITSEESMSKNEDLDDCSTDMV